MVYIKRVTEGAVAKVAAKCELMEPCCSVKDRWGHGLGGLGPGSMQQHHGGV